MWGGQNCQLMQPPTHCDTALQQTFYIMERTFDRCRKCLGIRTFQPRRYILMLLTPSWKMCTTNSMEGTRGRNNLGFAHEIRFAKNISTTQIYTHVTNPQLKNVHQKFYQSNKKSWDILATLRTFRPRRYILMLLTPSWRTYTVNFIKVTRNEGFWGINFPAY